MAVTVDVCPVEELPPGHVKIVWSGPIAIGVYNCGGKLYALEDRCSHDDGPLCEGEWEEDECIAICPRHGARFDITTGPPLSLPAYEPVETYPVRIEDGWVRRQTSRRACYIPSIRGKEVVRQWRFPVRAVEVPAGRDVPLGPARGIV